MGKHREALRYNSLGAIAGVTSQDLETHVARQKGIYSPQSGLPDAEAITAAFGFDRQGPVGRGEYRGMPPGCRQVARESAEDPEMDDRLY